MEVMFERCSGLDVHKRQVMANVRIRHSDGRIEVVKQTFVTTTNGLLALADWLASYGVTHVAMESTGVYWKPLYNMLHEAFDVWVVNARVWSKNLVTRENELRGHVIVVIDDSAQHCPFLHHTFTFFRQSHDRRLLTDSLMRSASIVECDVFGQH
jgi:hypothetical protein